MYRIIWIIMIKVDLMEDVYSPSLCERFTQMKLVKKLFELMLPFAIVILKWYNSNGSLYFCSSYITF